MPIAKDVTAHLAAVTEITGSSTLKELGAIRELLQAMLPGALAEGWTVIVDG